MLQRWSSHQEEGAPPGHTQLPEARISSGLSCDEGHHLALLPVALPAAIQHQGPKGC